MWRIHVMIVFSLSVVQPAAAAGPVNAVWLEQEVNFTFISLETAYSCDLLEGRFELLLRHIGASEVDVVIPSCNAFSTPRRQHRVRARFSTLVPAEGRDGEIIKAAWSEVVVDKRHPRSLEDRDCELLEHFQKYFLSAIDHEVIEDTLDCGATNRSIVGRLKINVLKPVSAEDVAETGD